MLGHPVLPRTFVLVLTAAGLGLTCEATAQPSTLSVATRSPIASAPASPADDVAMPEDMGAPIAGPASAEASPVAGEGAKGQEQPLSVNTPIDVIAATPQGKAALERELPGLCERPEYVMFRTMSPAKLALLSNGRISHSKLVHLQAHLVKVSVATPAEPPRHNLLAEGATRVKRFSRSAYRKVVSAIESL